MLFQKVTETPETKSKKIGGESKTIKPAKSTPDESSTSVDVGRLDFRIGRILSVEKHPDADSLYIEKVRQFILQYIDFKF